MIVGALTKLAMLLFGTTACTAVVTGVTGGTPGQIVNTGLNVAAVLASTFAWHFIRNLMIRIEEGRTPEAQVTFDMHDTVVDLREVVIDLREHLARGGVIDRRTLPDPPIHPTRRDGEHP